jgi:hypothetical protein
VRCGRKLVVLIGKRRTLINFLVYCPKGIVFLKYVDASYASKRVDILYMLFEEVV